MCGSLFVEGCCIHTIQTWAFWCQVTLHDVNPYLVAFLVSDQDLYSLHCLRFLVRPSYCLAWVLAMDVVLFMCLWLDHYLHQHGGCGPIAATWLGGVATFTTARDRCTETIFVLVWPLLDVFTWYFGFQSMLSCDLCFYWNVCISYLDDDSYYHISLLWWLACDRWCYLLVGLSYALLLAC